MCIRDRDDIDTIRGIPEDFTVTIDSTWPVLRALRGLSHDTAKVHSSESWSILEAGCKELREYPYNAKVTLEWLLNIRDEWNSLRMRGALR